MPSSCGDFFEKSSNAWENRPTSRVPYPTWQAVLFCLLFSEKRRLSEGRHLAEENENGTHERRARGPRERGSRRKARTLDSYRGASADISRLDGRHLALRFSIYRASIGHLSPILRPDRKWRKLHNSRNILVFCHLYKYRKTARICGRQGVRWPRSCSQKTFCPVISHPTAIRRKPSTT